MLGMSCAAIDRDTASSQLFSPFPMEHGVSGWVYACASRDYDSVTEPTRTKPQWDAVHSSQGQFAQGSCMSLLGAQRGYWGLVAFQNLTQRRREAQGSVARR